MGGLIIILMILLVIYRIWKSSSRKSGRKLMNSIPKFDPPVKTINVPTHKNPISRIDVPVEKKIDIPVKKDVYIPSIDSGVSNPVIKKLTWKDSYKEDLDDERWKEKREKILKRDGYKCRWCGSIDELQVHHKYYNKYPDGSRVKAWDYPDDALMVLCGDCHKKYHSKYKVKSYYRKKGIHYEKV